MGIPAEPLAFRVRPRTLSEFFGQQHVIGDGTPLRLAIERDALTSLLLSGPPGTGKTTLARIIADATRSHFVQLNAVMSGVKDLKEVCQHAEQLWSGMQQKTLLFVDEIHRFNTAQQDALLPSVESGRVILVGATTENPYFSVNAALVSRSHVYLLQPHSVDDLVRILRQAVADPRGYSGAATIADEALQHLATVANGDARVALNALELSLLTAGGGLTLEQAQSLFAARGNRYDRAGEDHYNTISAFIKTMRGSDPDAALIWLYKMLACGEDAGFLFRRMAIFACEDIGLADSHALRVVLSCQQAFEVVGLPEGEYFLAQACIYLSQAPKSNAVKKGMAAARSAVERAATLEVPNHLRNAPVKGMRQQGYGEGYIYPHDAAEGVAAANYFPVGMQPMTCYEPTCHGDEEGIRERWQRAMTIVRDGLGIAKIHKK